MAYIPYEQRVFSLSQKRNYTFTNYFRKYIKQSAHLNKFIIVVYLTSAESATFPHTIADGQMTR